MNPNLQARLNQILPKLTSADFLSNQGLGNEIGFWIFDYPPEEELEMRSFLQHVIEPALAKHLPAIRHATVDLFRFAVDLLEERKLLDKAVAMQQQKGDAAVLAALRPVLKEDKLAQKLVEQYDPANLDLLIITGVGAVYPMMRTHTLLSALHPFMKDTPLVMLYPGPLSQSHILILILILQHHLTQ